ncbi:PREDICTED: uncharacterized protein LOC105567861 isoform X3 [Vollenhovia emeryi]|nr:PREDICTED: uncharacterized protein LOC105567861 isoform X3 [Vollenhovia emeryi]
MDDSSIDKATDRYSAGTISGNHIVENEDNPCTSTDITFVDCGPTPQYFEPEAPVCYAHRKQVTPQEIKQKKNSRLFYTAAVNNKIRSGLKSHEEDRIHEAAITVRAGDNGSKKNLVKQSSKDNVQQCKTVEPVVKQTAQNNSKKTGGSKISDNSIQIGVQLSAKKSAITKTNLDHLGQSLQTSRINSNNSNVLTIQDSKKIASIINQLPPHLISNKKVVVIEQDSRNVIARRKNKATAKKDSSISVVDNNGADSNILSTQKMCDSNVNKLEVTGKIVIKDGKKYLIKRTKNITKNPASSNLAIVRNAATVTKQSTSEHNASESSLTFASSNEIENTDVEQTTSLHNNVSLLPPPPSLSEMSSSSSCDKKTLVMPQLQKIPPHLISLSAMDQSQKYIFETISLIKEENGDIYMDIKVVDRNVRESLRDVCDVIIKYRQEMFNEFKQMNTLELKERLDHLQCVSEEMKQMLNFISKTVLAEKLRAVDILQKIILKEYFDRFEQNNVRDNDVLLTEWETKVDPVHKCRTCNKLMKPKSYIAGFSKLSRNDDTYCSCYKQVCHVCLFYQGNTIYRFITHQNFHTLSKPYVCPDCFIKFDSATSLEVHTWTVCFHILKRTIFNCKLCGIDGFRDLESITRHFAIMHSKMKIGCENCLQVLASYSEYTQHCAQKHPSKVEQNPIRLVICKVSNVILRCENYMSYLEKYLGVKKLVWLKCPFCNLLTTANKHVTTLLNNHMRDSHLEALSKVLSKEAFIKIFGVKVLKAISFKSSQDGKLPTRLDRTVVPRIVNTRTISSEIFEHGSQGMECTWSAGTNKVVDESPMKKKVANKGKRELLPKIINVRSIDDIKASKPKEAITKFSNETKKKSNSSSVHVTIEIEEKKVNPFEVKCIHKTTMELDDSNEDTAKTRESVKDNELIRNALCVSDPFSVNTGDVRANSPIVSNKQVSNSTSERRMDGRIKVVDFRKICKPDVDQLFTEEMFDIKMKDENASYLPCPPPLTRIPQHLLEPVEVNESDSESTESRSKRSLVRGVTDESKVRIALGTDTQGEEGVDYLCHLCNERINSSQFVVQRHFREKHSDEYKVAVITPQLPRMSPDFINGGYKQFINNRKRKSDSAQCASRRKRRWTAKKHVEAKDTNPIGLCVEQETAEDGEGNFICKKCGQRCTDMPDLREHIAANHRLKGHYLICLECGENFVVAPSLQMHLKAFHGIEDPIHYMAQNPFYAPSDADLQSEGKTTIANQCYVCMAVFEDKAAVDKHLRVHGMAFLNRKRIEARNALEKKTSTEGDKSNLVGNDSKEAGKRDKPAETILEKINAAI